MSSAHAEQAEISRGEEEIARGPFVERLPLIAPSIQAKVETALHAMMPNGFCIIDHEVTDWASITFSGTRHEVRLHFHNSRRAEMFAARLPDHNWCIEGQLVADACVRAVHPCANGATILTAVLLLLDEVE